MASRENIRMRSDTHAHALHVRLSEDLREKLIKRMAKFRKEDPMASLSDVVRDLLEKALAAGL